MTNPSGSVLLAAGGTAGHLFPAFALAEELSRRNIPVDLMTDHRAERYSAGFPARRVYTVPAATLLSRSPLAVMQTGLTLSRGVLAAYQFLGEIGPAVAVGFGGYPTVPPLLAARLRGIRSVIHEQNAALGRANRLLARSVDAIATSFINTGALADAWKAKVHLTGNPVREAVVRAANMPHAAPGREGPFSLLIFGGSQGARFFADTVPEALARLPEETRTRLNVVQQAREEDVARVEAAYAGTGIRAEVATFFADLPQRMARAHLVIARAGATSVAELTAIGRPSILIPLPHAVEGDQLRNASELARAGGAWCLEQKDVTPERLRDEITRLAANPERLAQAAAAARACGRPDAVMRLAGVVERLMSGQSLNVPDIAPSGGGEG